MLNAQGVSMTDGRGVVTAMVGWMRRWQHVHGHIRTIDQAMQLVRCRGRPHSSAGHRMPTSAGTQGLCAQDLVLDREAGADSSAESVTSKDRGLH